MNSRPRTICKLAVVTLGLLMFARANIATAACGPGQAAVDAVGHCCSTGQVWNALTNECAAGERATCGPGQVAVDAVGHCCSPGQAWDAAAGDCSISSSAVPSAVSSAPMQMLQVAGANLNVLVPAGTAVDPTAPVAVTFVPAQPGDQETLRIQAISGATASCNVPCVVNLAPGYVTITGTGQRSFATALNVPPFDPITVQVNHLDSQTPRIAVGAVLMGIGLGGVIGGIYSIANIASCGDPMTPAEESALGACNNAASLSITFGGVAIAAGATALILGLVEVGTAAGRGQHPLMLMNPGQLSHRPITRRNSGWHFARFDAAPIPGGAVFQTGFTF